MTHPRETVVAIAEEYSALLLKMHSGREQGGKPRTWNRLVKRMQAAHLKLRATAPLEREAVAGGIAGFDAEISLREFDAGRLDTAWVPRLR